MTENRDRLVLAAFIAGAVLAGGNSVAIRFSNREIEPLFGAALRFGIAATLLTMLLPALRLEIPRGKALIGSVVYGLFQFSGAFGLYYFALVRVHAGVGQTLLALTPLATLLLAVAQRQERLRWTAIAGTLLVVAGIVFISYDPLRPPIPLVSLLAILGSVLCFAQALIVVRQFPPVHPVAFNAIGMVAGAAVLAGASAVFGEPILLPRRTETWIAIGYVTAVGSVVFYLLSIYVVQRWNASRAAFSMVLVPIVTIGLSAWLDREPITIRLVLGGLLVLTGVYIGALARPAGTPAQAGDRAEAASK